MMDLVTAVAHMARGRILQQELDSDDDNYDLEPEAVEAYLENELG